ncbi:hypothetical protein L7F22_048888 [Adiantum nelumboides]|nr:hypothetical protein [Adiantum nelumboides]
MVREVENPCQELQQLLLEDVPPSKRRGHASHEEPPPKERENESLDASMEDEVPQRRQAQKSPTPPMRKRSPHSPPCCEPKREVENSRKKKERKRSPSSPSSSPSSSSSNKNSSYSSKKSQRRGHMGSYCACKMSNKLKKFKEGGKNISFLTYDGTFGATNKVLAFIQQLDAAFGAEAFTKSSKLQHIAMHHRKSWWASLQASGEALKTSKALRAFIMKQIFNSDAKDKVLTKWQSLKLTPYESIHKYVEKFWDLHLKAIVYKDINFEKQKQQFCDDLPKDMNENVNSQWSKSFFAVIHHTMVASRINFQQGAKRNLKPMEMKDKHEPKGKNNAQTLATIKPRRRKSTNAKINSLMKSLSTTAKTTNVSSVECKGTRAALVSKGMLAMNNLELLWLKLQKRIKAHLRFQERSLKLGRLVRADVCHQLFLWQQ